MSNTQGTEFFDFLNDGGIQWPDPQSFALDPQLSTGVEGHNELPYEDYIVPTASMLETPQDQDYLIANQQINPAPQNLTNLQLQPQTTGVDTYSEIIQACNTLQKNQSKTSSRLLTLHKIFVNQLQPLPSKLRSLEHRLNSMSWRLQNGSKPTRGPPVGHKAAVVESNIREEAIKAKERVRVLERRTIALDQRISELQEETRCLKSEISAGVEEFLTEFRREVVVAVEQGVPGVKVVAAGEELTEGFDMTVKEAG